MCVGIPGQIVEIVDAATDTAMVEIGGARRAVNICCIVDDASRHDDCVGEWVLVHVGFAMARLNEDEAMRTLELLHELGEMESELEALAQDGAEADR